MKQKGISVIVTTKQEFDAVKAFLTPDVLYLDWHENMATRETGVVLKAAKSTNSSSGSVGCAKYQRERGINTVPFRENLTQYLL